MLLDKVDTIDTNVQPLTKIFFLALLLGNKNALNFKFFKGMFYKTLVPSKIVRYHPVLSKIIWTITYSSFYDF